MGLFSAFFLTLHLLSIILNLSLVHKFVSVLFVCHMRDLDLPRHGEQKLKRSTDSKWHQDLLKLLEDSSVQSRWTAIAPKDRGYGKDQLYLELKIQPKKRKYEDNILKCLEVPSSRQNFFIPLFYL